MTITPKTIAAFLEYCREKDQQGIELLTKSRVPVNNNLGDDPYVQVRKEDNTNLLGLLGLLNGLLLSHGCQDIIMASFDDEGKLLSFDIKPYPATRPAAFYKLQTWGEDTVSTTS
jgi:hypothetical protein